jgi:hypothetical protein
LTRLARKEMALRKRFGVDVIGGETRSPDWMARRMLYDIYWLRLEEDGGEIYVFRNSPLDESGRRRRVEPCMTVRIEFLSLGTQIIKKN